MLSALLNKAFPSVRAVEINSCPGAVWTFSFFDNTSQSVADVNHNENVSSVLFNVWVSEIPRSSADAVSRVTLRATLSWIQRLRSGMASCFMMLSPKL